MADFIIHCPKCNHAFEPGDSIREEVQNELRGQMKEWQKQKEIETAALIDAEKKKDACRTRKQSQKKYCIGV